MKEETRASPGVSSQDIRYAIAPFRTLVVQDIGFGPVVRCVHHCKEQNC
jgi:hypothetical protein